jgi:hypothetical protein
MQSRLTSDLRLPQTTLRIQATSASGCNFPVSSTTYCFGSTESYRQDWLVSSLCCRLAYPGRLDTASPPLLRAALLKPPTGTLFEFASEIHQLLLSVPLKSLCIISDSFVRGEDDLVSEQRRAEPSERDRPS